MFQATAQEWVADEALLDDDDALEDVDVDDAPPVD